MIDNSGNRPDYQVEDILEEAQRKKLERLKQPVATPSDFNRPETPVDFGTLIAKRERVKQAAEQIPEADSIPPVITEEKKPERIADSATRSFIVKQSTPEPEAGEEVKVYIPKRPVREDQKPDEPVNPAGFEDASDQEQPEELDQIRLDSLLEELPEEYTEKADDWEEQLQRERRKKAENFRLHPPVALRLSGDEEENDPSEEPEIYEEEEIEDFGSYEDTEAVRNELVYRRRTGWLQLMLTGMFALTLVGTSALYFYNWTAINPVLYVGMNVFLLAVAALVNHRSVGEGLGALFRMHASLDSMTSVLVLLAIIHTLLQFLDPEVITGDKTIVLAPVAAVALFFGALGRQMLVIRIHDNFKFVSYRGDKYAAHIIENRKTAAEIGRAAVAIGDPVVCYLEKTDFLTRFLENSYESDVGARTMRLYVPCAIGGSALLAAIFGVYDGSVMNALTVFVSAVSLSAPAGMLAAVNFPILRAARRVLRHGAMLVGWQAAEDFGNIHALAIDALEVFPSESVLLHGIKTFSGTRIDEAILDAAAVSIAAGGPLSSVFRRVIQNRIEILKEVDTLVYEQEMGMSGWVGGRRVLIGNRRLLENHGVDVPSRDYEARYTKNNRQIVYLSTAGELSAMFVISYVADEGIGKALKSLCGSGITLLVRTCDPNITEDLICQSYDLDSYYVEVMGAPAGRSYEQLLTQESEENDAVLASNGRLEGTALGVTYCRRLFNAVRFAMILQIIGGAIGISLAVLISLYTGILIPPLILIAYSTVWTILSWLLPCFNRV